MTRLSFRPSRARGARRRTLPHAERQPSPAVVSSVKANIGHTKAAAGVAGLIKATMALGAQILPPAVGCDEPHEELKGEASAPPRSQSRRTLLHRREPARGRQRDGIRGHQHARDSGGGAR